MELSGLYPDFSTLFMTSMRPTRISSKTFVILSAGHLRLEGVEEGIVGRLCALDSHEYVRRLLAELYHLLQLRPEHLVVLRCLCLLPDADGYGLLLRCLEDEALGELRRLVVCLTAR